MCRHIPTCVCFPRSSGVLPHPRPRLGLRPRLHCQRGEYDYNSADNGNNNYYYDDEGNYFYYYHYYDGDGDDDETSDTNNTVLRNNA